LVSGLRLAAVPNDNFVNRTSLVGTNVMVSGSNADASKELGEPNHANNNVGGRSVWWSWTAPTNADVTIKTAGTDFDTLLGVYSGSSVSTLTLVANNDDHGTTNTSRVRFQATAGVQYQIAVDGFNAGTGAGTGTIVLTLTAYLAPIVRPPNDNFANRILLTGFPVSATGSNFLATREAAEPVYALAETDSSVWWRWTASGADNIIITTAGSTFDTVLAVYTGSSFASLVEIASNDDEENSTNRTSLVSFSTSPGLTYQIVVDGFEGAFGQLALAIRSPRPFLSDPVLLPNGSFRFILKGISGRTNEIQSSTNLTSWQSFNTIVNSNGSTAIIDSTASASRRFYRAWELP
jgi:hypothetical protein